MNEPFYPALDDDNGGVISDTVQIVERIVGFIMNNPGDVSETHEYDVGSLGTIHMKHGESPGVLATEYETMLQKMIDQAIGVGVYTISVVSKHISNVEFALNLTVSDAAGENILTNSKEFRKLIGVLDE